MSVAHEQLLEVIRLLALEPDEQAAAFPPFVDFVDELAVLFGDQYEVVTIQKSLQPETDARRLLDSIDETFKAMAGHHEFFVHDAISQRAEWRNIRANAKRLVVLLKLDPRPPTLSWVTYVR